MDSSIESSPFDPSALAEDEMNWDAYAEHYDQMCEFNPSYQANIVKLLGYLSRWSLPSNATICDLGAGTGNYVAAMARILPNAHYIHVDFDIKMNIFANQKYQSQNIKSVRLLTEYAQQTNFPDSSLDLVVCVNALYAISPQKQILKNVYSWLKPNGRFFVIDFGRKQKTIDWAIYLFREAMKSHRAGEYVKAFIEGREVFKQNRRSSKGQESGRYWLHSTSEFGNTLVDCGFQVEEIYPCYRGYADLAVCKKNTLDE